MWTISRKLDRYLQGKTGEAEMIEDADAWPNYRGSYRPLVEFARNHQLPVIAANAPADIVRCIGRRGPDYLEQLSDDRRQYLPDDPFLDTKAYRAKFVEAITGSHSSGDPTMSERMNNSYKAQLLRDNTMASRILAARQQNPDAQILHLTGTFHSEDNLGTVALLRQRAPELSVLVVSPVVWPSAAQQPPREKNRNKGDYLYFNPATAGRISGPGTGTGGHEGPLQPCRRRRLQLSPDITLPTRPASGPDGIPQGPPG